MISLKKGKELTCKRTYLILEKESQALHEYVTDQLWKENIWPLKSSAGYEVLFVLKKDSRLWLCVDYQSLNTMMIKNRHPLS